ncbi:hypothetical protein OEZ86_009403 [Tetradesmus obliquus]|nr:hypothetical protein OEZ86_009403 [Tetradesmus obliquus]
MGTLEQAYRGTCDICGKEADAEVEECVSVECSANCHRVPDGDIYHTQCIKKYVSSGSKGTQGKCPKIPYSNFACPKGKTSKSASEEVCKGLVLHCKRIYARTEAKPPPVPVQASNGASSSKRGKGAGTASNAAEGQAAAPPKKKKPQQPRLSMPQPAVVKLPPIPSVPKADPLGRNLSKDKGPQELPPGMELAEDSGGAGKAAKKNQRRAARRKAAEAGDGVSSAGWEQGSNAANESGLGEAASGFGVSGAAGSTGGGSVDHASIMGTGKFITDISKFNALLAMQLGHHMAVSTQANARSA